MSSGNFVTTKYQSDQVTRIYNMRVQPETILLTLGGTQNNPPTGDVNQGVSAKARGGRRQIGVNARTVTLEWTAAPPDGYEDATVTVPILTPALYGTLDIGVTGTYLGAGVRVVGVKPEYRR